MPVREDSDDEGLAAIERHGARDSQAVVGYYRWFRWWYTHSIAASDGEKQQPIIALAKF